MKQKNCLTVGGVAVDGLVDSLPTPKEGVGGGRRRERMEVLSFLYSLKW